MHDTPSKTTPPARLRRWLALLMAAATIGGASFYMACQSDDGDDDTARAKRITSRDELMGGPTARAEIGDYLLENDKIRVAIEDVGFAKGSGIFGGSLIDADRVHQNHEGDLMAGNGQDTFGETFPAFFLEMLDPEEVVVVEDGSEGGAAVVEVRGRGGEFVTMLRLINQVMVNSYEPDVGDILAGHPAHSDGEPLIDFTIRYVLEPGAEHVRIESEMTNRHDSTVEFPSSVLDSLEAAMDLDLGDFRVPLGMVLGFGELNDMFVPGIGYDLHWGLDEAYQADVDLPAFPGELTDVVASSNTDGTNYGFISGASEEDSFAHARRDIYEEAYDEEVTAEQMLMLFSASGFSGVFTHQMPEELEPEESFTFTNHLIVGDGDVASIRDEAYRIRGEETQKVAGRIFDEHTGEAVGEEVSLLIYRTQPGAGCDAEGADAPSIDNQAFTNKEGRFELELPPGDYCYRTRSSDRPLSDFKALEVADEAQYLRINAPSSGRIEARIYDEDGNPIPARMTVVGTHEYQGDEEKRHFLYDLRAGESWRTSDMVPDEEDDPSTREYVEASTYAGADGNARASVRPGTYDVYLSRGPEYDLEVYEDVEVAPGKTPRLQGSLERVVDTSGYLSGDFHLHARGSIDSGIDYNDRVKSVAAEGVEVAASSDHNYVSDYEPYIYRNELDEWLTSVVGLELTTFEFGHFNAFPLEYDVGSITKGSVPWQNLPPQKIFDELRDNGSLSADDTVIQINHPRDTILGYFGQYDVDPFDTGVDLEFLEESGQDKLIATAATSTGPAFMRDCSDVDCRGDEDYETTFSWDFDAIEVFNGKHLELLRHYRVPYDEGEWPEETAEALIETVCTEEDEHQDELDDFCDDNDIDECEHPLDGYDIDDWCSFGEEELHERYPKGDIICDGDEVAFPGGLDDWYNTLNYPREWVRGDDLDPGDPVYKKFTATGNSDSHGVYKPGHREPGSPRNYFWVGHDDPARMTEAELAEAMQNQQNIVTNGPFVSMRINDERVGGQTAVDGDRVDIEVTVRAADWVGADRFRIMANGEPAEMHVDGEEETVEEHPVELNDEGEFETTVGVDIDRDTWFVLEVEGDDSLFPIYTPQEVPQIAFDEAVGGIADSFGISALSGGLEPDETFPLTPFAFTNPIWVIHEGDEDDEFTPPAPPERACTPEGVEQNALVDGEPVESKRLDTVQMPVDHGAHEDLPTERLKGEQRDVRTLFENWGHSH
ncbi:MAG: hypothetical protein ACOCV2_06260 [Persicimonas sp.]